MPTIQPSGSYNFQLSSFDCIKQAFLLCGLQTSTLTYADMEFARIALNILFADWTSQNYANFDTVQNIVNLTQGQMQIALPTNIFDVIEASIRTVVSGQPIDAPLLNRVSVNTYQSFPDKTTQSEPTMYYLKRSNTPVDPPIMYLYPTPSNNTLQLSYFAITQIQDVNSSSGFETPGVPYRWIKPMVDGLAKEISKYKGLLDRFPILESEYEKSFMIAAAGDADKAGLEVIWDLNSTKKFR